MVTLLDDGDGKSHACHIMAAHLAGHLVPARARRLERVVDTVNCSRINQVDTNEHVLVLCVLIERSAIRFIGYEGKGVIVIAAIGDDEMVRDAGMKDFHRGDDLVVDKHDIDRYRAWYGSLVKNLLGWERIADLGRSRGSPRRCSLRGRTVCSYGYARVDDDEQGENQ